MEKKKVFKYKLLITGLVLLIFVTPFIAFYLDSLTMFIVLAALLIYSISKYIRKIKDINGWNSSPYYNYDTTTYDSHDSNHREYSDSGNDFWDSGSDCGDSGGGDCGD